MRTCKGVLAAVATFCGIVALVGPVSAQSDVTGPAITLDRYEMAPGDTIVVRADGFLSNSVTLAVCGNRAIRGSGDCNMAASKGVGLDAGVRAVEMVISAPPAPCPCIIRAFSPNNDEVAIAPITLIGHPTGPLVGAELADALDAVVVVNPASTGFIGRLRAGLGGATMHTVDVSVINISTDMVTSIRVTGSVGRIDGDELANFDVEAPAELAPGQRFEKAVDVELPTPSWGDVEWRIVVASNEPTVAETEVSRNVPWLLWILGALLAVDLLVLFIRLIVKTLRRRSGEESIPELSDPLDRPAEDWADSPGRQLVS